ncbi:Rossmann-like and DUF2520 domain-containing protein [Leeuwenhoekiella sp. NPDC079379]|uniref:Rossmann-like and DUF2520 domain-containing protein n=1 Tax=Leeuwenhoekiella sp. NPDC079379 TaxID=3364122 RepID=UPI0037CA55CA
MITLSIIGTGNVAFHLAHAFSTAQGINLQFVAGRNQKSLVDFKEFASTTTTLTKTHKSDVIIIAVSDVVISEICNELEGIDSLIVHTSGSTSIEVLNTLKRYGVFYPLQTFTKSKKLNYSKIPFCIEVKLEGDLSILKSLSESLNAESYAVNSTERAALHLAAVFSNNFSNHILTEAKQLCYDNGVSFNLLKPLLEETIEKAFALGPENSQTGPAKRGDTITIDKQLSALTRTGQRAIYNTLTQSILKHYE